MSQILTLAKQYLTCGFLKAVVDYLKCLGFVEGDLIGLTNFTVDASEIGEEVERRRGRRMKKYTFLKEMKERLRKSGKTSEAKGESMETQGTEPTEVKVEVEVNLDSPPHDPPPPPPLEMEIQPTSTIVKLSSGTTAPWIMYAIYTIEEEPAYEDFGPFLASMSPDGKKKPKISPAKTGEIIPVAYPAGIPKNAKYLGSSASGRLKPSQGQTGQGVWESTRVEYAIRLSEFGILKV
ncbi:unnamed protein product [Darwinula stevensoni]|uniref:Uncharacterized protein n=1 Tax=Darwinula stevensoni TaxID=69355 RepID=A0A7R8X7T1_9CRUS|nr:unnamed protein product [Darwinula stevensoni]CAG0882652.1 unnamed protein product [Darwinula stevensoni]